MESNIESNIENNLESLMKGKMGYVDFTKSCSSCTYQDSGKCFLNPVRNFTVEKNACCDFWKEEIPADIDKLFKKTPKDSDIDRVGPDITPEYDMLKS